MNGRRQINCTYCGKEKLSRNEIGLNKKLIHRQIEQMMCLSCMAEDLETTEEEIIEMIEIFKRQGCELFS
ncbi:hypothetical protein B2D07_18515 [Desulfococcus multivorans]|uniref:Uncharacterized protein n=1 Tax=Desulfococcus multivorans DSM 2059 TaxID=1121405 RepID=S7T7L2_DESML|nr:conserved uncharacterized protein [Desulfococcus multivorans]AQV02568.1 hypothetical protein B2D07_18515 [Desulfococcus multivorans]EPR32495.1 hypothetical protein dsmv_0868 [Desulfococcus multivorans DSM 2059]SKA27780.1 hypothetical protein SAMN02745446_03731 [Desulfococcus multivorans DSM 2059]